jgi:hypothetical protein
MTSAGVSAVTGGRGGFSRRAAFPERASRQMRGGAR